MYRDGIHLLDSGRDILTENYIYSLKENLCQYLKGNQGTLNYRDTGHKENNYFAFMMLCYVLSLSFWLSFWCSLTNLDHYLRGVVPSDGYTRDRCVSEVSLEDNKITKNMNINIYSNLVRNEDASTLTSLNGTHCAINLSTHSETTESVFEILKSFRTSNVNRLTIGQLNINSVRNKFDALISIEWKLRYFSNN